MSNLAKIRKNRFFGMPTYCWASSPTPMVCGTQRWGGNIPMERYVLWKLRRFARWDWLARGSRPALTHCRLFKPTSASVIVSRRAAVWDSLSGPRWLLGCSRPKEETNYQYFVLYLAHISCHKPFHFFSSPFPQMCPMISGCALLGIFFRLCHRKLGCKGTLGCQKVVE